MRRWKIIIIFLLVALVVTGGVLAYYWYHPWGIPKGELKIERLEFKYEMGTLISDMVSNVTLDKTNFIFETAGEVSRYGLKPNTKYSCFQTSETLEGVLDEVSQMIRSAKPFSSDLIQKTPVYSAKVVLQSGKVIMIVSQGPIFINNKPFSTEIDIFETISKLTEDCIEQQKAGK